MNTKQQSTIKLINKFGISLDIDITSGIYEVLCKGQSWLGRGLVSVLYNKAWYRNLVSTEKTCNDLSITYSKREDNLSDDIGTHTRVSLRWKIKDTECRFNTDFKFYYEKPCILFEIEYPAVPPYIVFPQFVCGGPAKKTNFMHNWVTTRKTLSDIQKKPAGTIREDLHSWVPCFMGTYRTKHNTNAAFGFEDSERPNTAVPLILYDADYETLILSPYENFLVSHQYTEMVGGSRGFGFGTDRLICCGLNRNFDIPSGFKHSTILYFGSGINKTAAEYGDILLKKAGKQRPDKYNDNTISYLSYWVDYGSYYWDEIFTNEKQIDYEDMMTKLAREAEQNGLVIKSWQVQDGDQNRWEEGLFDLKEEIMPHGMKYLRDKIGQPLYSYFSPLEPGPYREKYPYVFTGHVAYGGRSSTGMGDLFYTEEFWDDQVKKIKEWGSEGLQHDFLSDYWNSPAAVNYIDRYMKSMAKACVKYGISQQYCMCLSNHLLETTENMAVVSLQAISDHYICEKDGGCGANLRSFIFSSMLYNALGLWPARDNIQTMADADAYQDILVANLSGGPIQLGHELGKADLSLLRKTFREGDGLLLKPNRPLTPIDRCFIEEDSLIAYTETKNQAGEWKYVLALNIAYDGWNGGFFTPAECGGDAEEYIIYDFINKTVKKTGREEKHECPDGVKHSYYILAPILKNGFALIGDINKFVTMADKRITNVTSEKDREHFDVLSGGNTNALIAGYSAAKPSEFTVDGVVCRQNNSMSDIPGNSWCWDAKTGMWNISVDFSADKEIIAKTIMIKF